jgi:divalent metal cation (Fe/Co/Zn/Cd) transporter
MDTAGNIPVAEIQVSASIARLQGLTIAWMCVELLIAAVVGAHARSVALTSFAGDSAIELLSAAVVLRRFQIGIAAERSAARVTAALLYLLAIYIAGSSAFVLLSHRLQPQPTYLGIALLIAAAVIMPVLGRAKKRLAVETGSRALKADATQSSVCASMSWIALAGVGVNTVFHLPWTDSVAALLILPLVLKEAKDAMQGKACC